MNIGKFFTFSWINSLDKAQVRFGVIAIALLISLTASYWGTLPILAGVLGLVVGLGGVLILMRYLNLGYILIILSGMFIPIKGPGGFNLTVLLVIAIIIFWIMDMFVVKHRFHFVKSRVLTPPLFFMIISVIAFGMGQISWYSLGEHAPLATQIGGFSIYFFSAATMVAAANIIDDERWLKAIMWTLIPLGVLYMLSEAVGISQVSRFFQSGVTQNSMFWTWMMALPLGQAMYNKKMDFKFRILLYMVALIVFAVGFLGQRDWKSGWVPPLVVVGVLVGLRYPRLIVVGLPLVLVGGIYLTSQQIATEDYSWGTRVDAWKLVFQISKVSPFFGHGFANYYWYALLFPIRGWRVNYIAHSQYVDLFAQTGLFGLLCFLWIFFEVGRLSWKLIGRLPDGFALGYAYSVFAGVFGTLMAAYLVDWVLPFAYNIGLDGVRSSILPWIFFGGLASIERIYRVKQNKPGLREAIWKN